MHEPKATRNKTLTLSEEEISMFKAKLTTLPGRQSTIQTLLDKTVQGDFFQIAPLLPPNSMDLIIADPPYNLTKRFQETVFTKKNERAYEDYTRSWITLCAALLKETGSIYVCCDWQSSLIVGRVLGEFFHIRNRLTWQREKGRGAKHNWKNCLEDIWFATKSNTYTFHAESVKTRRKVIAPYRENGKPKDWKENAQGKYRDTYPSNFFDDITIPFWSMKENTPHPTQKPEKLIAKLILASSNEQDLVFDPFLGSGTTSVVAKKLHRHYLGIEQQELYCLWALKRLSQAASDKTIQGYHAGVFWPRNTLPDQK